MSNIVFEWEKAGDLEPGNLTRQELQEIANSANNRYREIFIQKGVKKRQIFVPEDELELLQRLILRYYLKADGVHPNVYSYVPGASLIEHVEQHKDYPFTLRLDILNFFGSISDSVVFKYFSELYSLELAEFLMKVTCRRGSLPIGAPSSPMLTNLIMRRLDNYWSQNAQDNNAQYTRYSDDLFFSADSREWLGELIPRFETYLRNLFPFLKLNNNKTSLLSGNNRKITGLVITKSKSITLGRAKKRELRALLDKYQKGFLSDKSIRSLRGRLLFLQGHDTHYFSKLESKYAEEISKIYSACSKYNNNNNSEVYVAAQTVNSSLNDSFGVIHSDNSRTRIDSFKIPSHLQHIQSYFGFGWQLIPCHEIRQGICSCGKSDCKSPGKHPCVRHGVYDATSDYNELLPWLEKGCNVGIATGFASGIVVLDIDVHKGGHESFQRLFKFIGAEELSTLQCRTGGGGLHLYFSYPSPVLKNRIGILPGIDFKTDGGYVMAPPSNHISGDRYIWIGVNQPNVDSIKPLPESLTEFLKTAY
jgi:RNA-directed DNA polymerase